MKGKYVIALDQGTTSCRAVLVNNKGQMIAKTQQEFTQHFPQSGWVEHDALEILQVQKKVFEVLIQNNDIKAEDIACIGITNQRETTVVWDKTTGKPVYNAIVWQDKRTADFCKELKNRGLEAHTKSRMGLPIDPYFSGTKIKWILDKVGRHENLLVGTIDTWLIWNLTEGRNHVTDYTNASRTLLFDIVALDWDKKMLEELYIPIECLPSVQNSASHFGDFHFQGREIPITGVAGDQQAALFGQACFEKGSAKNTYGTGCFMLMQIGDTFVQSQNGLLTTLSCNQSGEPTYALEGSIFTAGAAVQWLRDSLQVIDDSSETESLALSVQDEHEVVIIPAFAGLGAPYWNMDARGAIYGLTRATTKAHIAKATLDSIAYRTKDVLTAMCKDADVDLKILRVDGGATNNNYLLQFQADILNVAVERPKNVESTVLGAAYLAGLQIDFWDSKLITQSREIDQVYSPSLAKEKREELYQKWLKLVQQTLV